MAAGKEQRKRRKNNMQKFITNIFSENALSGAFSFHGKNY